MHIAQSLLFDLLTNLSTVQRFYNGDLVGLCREMAMELTGEPNQRVLLAREQGDLALHQVDQKPRNVVDNVGSLVENLFAMFLKNQFFRYLLKMSFQNEKSKLVRNLEQNHRKIALFSGMNRGI